MPPVEIQFYDVEVEADMAAPSPSSLETPVSLYSFNGGGPMGIALADVKSSIVVYEVEADSLAATQGLRAQSVLLQVNGVNVSGLGAATTKELIASIIANGQSVWLGVDESRVGMHV